MGYFFSILSIRRHLRSCEIKLNEIDGNGRIETTKRGKGW